MMSDKGSQLSVTLSSSVWTLLDKGLLVMQWPAQYWKINYFIGRGVHVLAPTWIEHTILLHMQCLTLYNDV